MVNDVPIDFQWDPWVSLLLFGVLALPLVLQDLKDNSVSEPLLIAISLLWWTTAFATTAPLNRLIAAAIVLLVGSLLLTILPGRLGEADVVFISGMAALFSFWPLIFSLGLGCLAALMAYSWMFRKNPRDVMVNPLPFLPSLYWGGLTIALGRLVL